jgi:hypothetical protein
VSITRCYGRLKILGQYLKRGTEILYTSTRSNETKRQDTTPYDSGRPSLSPFFGLPQGWKRIHTRVASGHKTRAQSRSHTTRRMHLRKVTIEQALATCRYNYESNHIRCGGESSRILPRRAETRRGRIKTKGLGIWRKDTSTRYEA